MKKENISIFGIVCLSFLSFFSCNGNANKYACEGFNFSVKFDLNDSYDSKTNLFKRFYWEDSVQISIKLTNSEINKIRQTFQANDFLNLPDAVSCNNIFERVIPSNQSVVYFENKCTSKKVNFEFNSVSAKKSKPKRILSIIDTISTIIYNNPEVKNLKPSNVFLE